MSKQIILYVPGLGDHNLTWQQRALKLWRIYGVQTEICAMNWLVDEPWDAKLQRLLERIDFHHTEGREVSLVGVSAGSTAILQAIIKRRNEIKSAVLVSGKFQYPDTVHPMRYKMNPALHNALIESSRALNQLTNCDKQKLRLFRPIYDNLLPSQEIYIPGVKTAVMPAITHVGGIAYAITLGSWQIVRFLKKTS
jgi:hypothetical protein